MKQTTRITIEHIVVASDRSYEHVSEALEAQLGRISRLGEHCASIDHDQYILGASYPDRRTAAWDKRFYHLE